MARMRAVYMQPNVETKSDWTVSGAATDLAAVQKGQGVVAAPDTATYVSSTTTAQGETFGFPTFTPDAGEYVSYVRAHIYATTQANHTIGFTAYYSTSSPIADSPKTVVPASSSAAWFHSPKLAPRGNATDSYRYITQADIGSLQVGFTLTESSAQAGTSKVYAVVLEVGLSTMEHLETRDRQMLGPIEIFPARFVGAKTGEDANDFKSWGYQWGDTSAEYASETAVRIQLVAMRKHGANTIRVHVPYGGSGTGSSGYMVDATTPNETRFAEFERFLNIAEGLNMRVIVTGLNLYLPANRPTFLAALNEADRWASFGVFWGRLAQACAGSPSVIVLDLINEIHISDPNSTNNSDYYGGNLGGKYYFAAMSIKWNGRTATQVIDGFYDALEVPIRLWEPVKPIGCGGAFPNSLSSQFANRVDIWLPHIYTSTPIQAGLDSLALYYATGQPVINEESGDVTGTCPQGQNRQMFVTAQQNYLVGTNTNWNEGGIDGDTSGNFANSLLRAVNVIPFVEATPDAIGQPLERLTIDGLALHDTGFVLEQLTLDPPAKRYNRTQFRDGSGLAEPPGRDDRTISFKLRAIDMDADSLDRAFHQLQILRGKLEEADRLVAEGQPGLAATWVASGSVWPMTVYITGGDVTAVPKDISGDSVGYFQKVPVAEVTLTCKPFLYGDPVTMLLDSEAGPMGSSVFTDVLGDVPAEAELEVRDVQGQARRHVEWGLQQRNFNFYADALTLDSDAVTVAGYSGTATTRTGAYDPGASGNNVVRATPTGSPITMCGMTALTHMGRFRVRARLFGMGALFVGVTIKVRLRYRTQSGQWTSLPWVDLPIYGVWSFPELGSIVLPRVTVPSWDWELDCLGVGGTTSTVDFDCLTLLPVDEGYGRSSSPVPDTNPSVLVVNDDFNSLTAAASLNGRVAPAGGTWATTVSGGSPADFVGSTPAGSVFKGGLSEYPNTRRALIPTSRTTCEVGALVWGQQWTDGLSRRVIIARFVDGNNYLMFGTGTGGNPGYGGVFLMTLIGGVVTGRAWMQKPVPAGTWLSFRMIVYDTGWVSWHIRPVSFGSGGVVTPLAMLGEGWAYIAECATGGVLASGTCGFESYNWAGSNNVTFVDNFYVSTAPPAEAPIVPVGGRVRFGATQTAPAERELSPDAWSRAPYQGSRFYLPAAGDGGYWSRLAWVAARNDPDVAESVGLDDVAETRVTYTPRYVDVPGV